MPYTVEFLKTAEEELAALPKEAQRQILTRIEGLATDPRPAGIKQLRAGDYRVIYLVEGKNLVVLIVRVGDRKDVYEGLETLIRRVHVRKQSKKPEAR